MVPLCYTEVQQDSTAQLGRSLILRKQVLQPDKEQGRTQPDSCQNDQQHTPDDSCGSRQPGRWQQQHRTQDNDRSRPSVSDSAM